MARGKKAEKVLTPEEKLEQALVPVEEQPYPVPENWCWTRVGAIASVKGGKRVPKGKQLVEYKTEHPYIRVTDFDNQSIIVEQIKYVDDETFNMIHNYTISKKDIYISIAGTIGKVGIVPDILDGANLTENAAKITNIRGIEQRYLLWLLQSELTQIQIKDYTISTTQPKLALFRIENINVPFPPYDEQQRIVHHIESLFVKLDEAKEKVQAVVDGFEIRRAAILHKAFAGELTGKWRKEHNIKLDSWQICTLESVCKSIFDGDHMPPPKAESGVPFLMISNVNTGYLSYENTRYVPQDYYDSLNATRKPELGDVLYTLVGSYGIPVVVDDERPFCFQRHIALLKPKDLNTHFLWYLLQSQEMYNKATNIATGTAQLTVPIKGLRKMEFRKPSEDEQKEIVCILNSLFVKEKRVKEVAEEILGQIETMKKSVLARAFRGELGTNVPSEERAAELLKSIL